jgi:hypothetical protein
VKSLKIAQLQPGTPWADEDKLRSYAVMYESRLMRPLVRPVTAFTLEGKTYINAGNQLVVFWLLNGFSYIRAEERIVKPGDDDHQPSLELIAELQGYGIHTFDDLLKQVKDPGNYRVL